MSPQSLVSRIERLERTQRRWQILALAGLLGLATAMMQSRPASQPTDVIEAQRFVLRDPNGAVCAVLGFDRMDESEFADAGLFLFAAAAKPVAGFRMMHPNVPSIPAYWTPPQPTLDIKDMKSPDLGVAITSAQVLVKGRVGSVFLSGSKDRFMGAGFGCLGAAGEELISLGLEGLAPGAPMLRMFRVHSQPFLEMAFHTYANTQGEVSRDNLDLVEKRRVQLYLEHRAAEMTVLPKGAAFTMFDEKGHDRLVVGQLSLKSPSSTAETDTGPGAITLLDADGKVLRSIP